MILRQLLVELGLDVNEQSFAKGALAAKGIEKAFGLIVDAAKSVAHMFYENIKAAIEYGDHLDEVSQSVGLTTESLQELHYASSMSGVSSDEMNVALMKLSKTMQAAADGGESQSEAFKKLGVSVKGADGKLRSSEDVLQAIAEKFADESFPDGAKKTALAMDVLGKSGAKLIPFLNQGSDEIERLREEAHEMGLVMDDKAIKASAELGDSLDRLKATTKGLWRTAVGPLLPVLNDVVKRFLAWRKENAAWIRMTLEKYVKHVITAFKVLGNTIAAMWNVGSRVIETMWMGLKKIAVTAFELMNVFGKFKWVIFGALAFALSPLLAIAGAISAITLLVDDYLTYKKHPKAKTLFGLWKKTLDEWLKPNDNDPWWLKAIKEFVRFVKEALDLVNELTGKKDQKDVESMANRGASKKAIQEQADRGTLETARQRLRLGLPLTDKAKEALTRTGVSEAAFVGKHAAPPPSIAARTAGGVPSSLAANTVINIQQQPGENGEDLAKRVRTYVEDFWGVKMEEAAAGASR